MRQDSPMGAVKVRFASETALLSYTTEYWKR